MPNLTPDLTPDQPENDWFDPMGYEAFVDRCAYEIFDEFGELPQSIAMMNRAAVKSLLDPHPHIVWNALMAAPDL